MSIYDFIVRKTDGTTQTLKEYEGKVVLIVNTASYCGYTKQLFGLERDFETLKDKGYVVIAFPANQFKNQEPDAIDDIVEHYKEEYNVSFPIMNKVLVNGEDADPLFEYLKKVLPYDPESKTPETMIPHYLEMDKSYKENSDIKWNFTKFLINRKGEPIKRFEPEETPSMFFDVVKEEVER